jgi:hypothetical protein
MHNKLAGALVFRNEPTRGRRVAFKPAQQRSDEDRAFNFRASTTGARQKGKKEMNNDGYGYGPSPFGGGNGWNTPSTYTGYGYDSPIHGSWGWQQNQPKW